MVFMVGITCFSLLGSAWFYLCVIPHHELLPFNCSKLSVCGPAASPVSAPEVLFCWAVIPCICQKLPTAFYWEWQKWVFLGCAFYSYLHVNCITTRNRSFYKFNILKGFFLFLLFISCTLHNKIFGEKKCTFIVSKKFFVEETITNRKKTLRHL